MFRPLRIPRSLVRPAVFCLVSILLFAPALSAQQPDTATPPPADSDPTASDTPPLPDAGSTSDADEDPTLTALIDQVDRAVKDWYQTLGQMRALQIRFHNGAAGKDAEFRRRFRELEVQSREGHEVALQAAIELVNYRQEGIPGVWDFLISSVGLRGENDWYESVAEAAQAIHDLKESDLKVDLTFPMLDAYLGRALVTEGEWERARQALQRAIQGPEAKQADFRLLSLIDTLPERWEREQELRRREAAANDLPRVLLETTRGEVVIELFEDQAPNTVANFIQLVEQGFYDQLPFYTVIDQLFAVTGDPIGDGSGDAGYRIPDEADHPDARTAFRGSLFMAKIPDPAAEPGNTIPDTASSQFMITYLPMPLEQGDYTVFGRVIEGMPNVSLLTRVNPDEKKGENAEVLPPDRILAATVLRKRDHDYDLKRIEFEPNRDSAPAAGADVR